MKLPLIHPERCQPQACQGGICAARRACPTRAIYQEEPLEVPFMDPQRCRSCARCIAGCPLKAIEMV